MNEKIKAAAIGGVIIGILSVIPLVSTCCCLWAIGGGLLAGYLYYSKLPYPVSAGDGAIIGAQAGGIGAIIYTIISIPISLIFGAAQMQQVLRQMQAQGMKVPPALFALGAVGLTLVGIVIMIVSLVLFAMIGGLISVPLFGKKGAAPYQTPPPPPYGT